MISFYPAPKLMQRIAATPYGLWGFTRLNNAYTGPIYAVNNSGSGSTDVYNDAGLLAAATSTAFANVTVVYDQSGNGRHLTPSQDGPNMSFTGTPTLQKVGRQVMGRWDGGVFGGNTVLQTVGADLSAFTGSPAMTVAHVVGTFSQISGRYHFAVGGGASPYNGLALYFVDGSNIEVQFDNTTVKKRFTVSPSFPTSPDLPQVFIVSKAASQDISTVSLRRNGSAMTETGGPASGAQNFGSNRELRWGGSSDSTSGGTLRAAMHGLCLAVWTAEITGQQLADLEGYLLGLREAARTA